MCEKCDKLKKILLEIKEDVRDYITGVLKDSKNVQEALEMPLEDIPLHLNDQSRHEVQKRIMKIRLEGKDPFEEDLGNIVPILADEEFDYEYYREIGYNDGMSQTVGRLLDVIELKEDARQAREATYWLD